MENTKTNLIYNEPKQNFQETLLQEEPQRSNSNTMKPLTTFFKNNNPNDQLKLLQKLKILEFNHISSNLLDEQIEMLIHLYAYYHKLNYIYRKSGKIYKNMQIAFSIIGGLCSATAIVSIITIPLIAVASAITIITVGVDKGLNLSSKCEKCETAASCFQDILDDLRSYIRGDSYNADELIDEVKIKEKMVKFPNAIGLEYYSKKYDKKYNKLI